ncbi:MAG TPA: hypothetical protein EYF98_13730, partial [Planctomycetes bacterium]|nr:hypothetical protein [Planctomycetota bacterium]
MGADLEIIRGVTHVPYSTSASTVDTQIFLAYPFSAYTAPRWAFVRLLSNNGYVQAVNKDGLDMPQGCTAGDQSAVVSLHANLTLMMPQILVRVECGPSTATWNAGVTEVDRYVAWEVWEYVGDIDADDELYIPGATPESEELLLEHQLNQTGGLTLAQVPKCISFNRGISWEQETAGAGIPGGYTDETKYGCFSAASIDLFGNPGTLVSNSANGGGLHATERATAHFDTVWFKGSNWDVTFFNVDNLGNRMAAGSGTYDLTQFGPYAPADWSKTAIINGGHRWSSDNDADAGLVVYPHYDDLDTLQMSCAVGDTFATNDGLPITLLENAGGGMSVTRFDNLSTGKNNVDFTGETVSGKRHTYDIPLNFDFYRENLSGTFPALNQYASLTGTYGSLDSSRPTVAATFENVDFGADSIKLYLCDTDGVTDEDDFIFAVECLDFAVAGTGSELEPRPIAKDGEANAILTALGDPIVDDMIFWDGDEYNFICNTATEGHVTDLTIAGGGSWEATSPGAGLETGAWVSTDLAAIGRSWVGDEDDEIVVTFKPGNRGSALAVGQLTLKTADATLAFNANIEFTENIWDASEGELMELVYSTGFEEGHVPDPDYLGKTITEMTFHGWTSFITGTPTNMGLHSIRVRKRVPHGFQFATKTGVSVGSVDTDFSPVLRCEGEVPIPFITCEVFYGPHGTMIGGGTSSPISMVTGEPKIDTLALWENEYNFTGSATTSLVIRAQGFPGGGFYLLASPGTGLESGLITSTDLAAIGSDWVGEAQDRLIVTLIPGTRSPGTAISGQLKLTNASGDVITYVPPVWFTDSWWDSHYLQAVDIPYEVGYHSNLTKREEYIGDVIEQMQFIAYVDFTSGGGSTAGITSIRVEQNIPQDVQLLQGGSVDPDVQHILGASLNAEFRANSTSDVIHTATSAINAALGSEVDPTVDHDAASAINAEFRGDTFGYINHDVDGTGNFLARGDADPTVIHDLTGNANAAVSGGSIASNIIHLLTSNPVATLTGDVDPTVVHTVDGVGNVVLGGDTSNSFPTIVHAVVSTGSGNFAGSADPTVIHDLTGNANSVPGGSADPTVIHDLTANANAKVSASTPLLSVVHAASAAINRTFGGTSVSTVIHDLVTAAVATMSGSVDSDIVHTVTASVDKIIGGSADA